MKAIIVEDVEGLEDCGNVTALSLVWEDRIVVDAKLRAKPRLRRNVLRHERRHVMNVRKRGMTDRAGWVNRLIEMEYTWSFIAGVLLFGILLSRALWLVPFSLVPWGVNHLYWRYRP